MKHRVASVLSALMLVTAPVVSAEGGIREQQVQFKKGESGTTIKGSIKGDQTVDYKLRANAGQTMVVKFKPSNASAYFNVLPPGSKEAIFIGSTLGNDFFSGQLAASGEYTIRVYPHAQCGTAQRERQVHARYPRIRGCQQVERCRPCVLGGRTRYLAGQAAARGERGRNENEQWKSSLHFLRLSVMPSGSLRKLSEAVTPVDVTRELFGFRIDAAPIRFG